VRTADLPGRMRQRPPPVPGLGLLHDLTNCLRIGDITEFRPDGSKLLYEIAPKPQPTGRVTGK